MILLILRWIAAMAIAFIFGKLVSKLKLPSILGWLIGGMVLGPYAFSLLPDELINAAWYENTIHVLECAVGLMIGTELVWKRIRKYGKALLITTLTQSLGTFAVVSAVFCITFAIRGIPIYLAFLFGGIALATAPAPALSIVREFRTDGPVTRTLIPMAALDDMVGVAVFFTAIAIVARHLSGASMPVWMIPVIILLPGVCFVNSISRKTAREFPTFSRDYPVNQQDIMFPFFLSVSSKHVPYGSFSPRR
jgi:Kef-type K+ transport system membrane component KefB